MKINFTTTQNYQNKIDTKREKSFKAIMLRDFLTEATGRQKMPLASLLKFNEMGMFTEESKKEGVWFVGAKIFSYFNFTDLSTNKNLYGNLKKAFPELFEKLEEMFNNKLKIEANHQEMFVIEGSDSEMISVIKPNGSASKTRLIII